jgi:branched-chain amino acid transport system ATP-binding protein
VEERNMTAVLRTQGLCRYFGAVTAAKDITISVESGEVVGVIGSNGAGKTTFINMVTGYLPPSAGEIWFMGESVKGLQPRQITHRGMSRSFQVPQLFQDLSVLDNLFMALAAADNPHLGILRPVRTQERRRRAEPILEEMGIAAYRDESVSAMPQGARKLLDIAMAMVGSPRMLLLDEPTSGVSAEEKHSLMQTVMAAVTRQQLTVLFVEHDMEIVQSYVTRVLAFADGAIISDGTPAEVLGDVRVQELVSGRRVGPRTAGGSGA